MTGKRLCALFLLLSLLLGGCARQTGGGADDPAADPHPNRSHLLDERLATPENPAPSPSGAYTLVIVSGFYDNAWQNRIEVYGADAPSEPLFLSEKFYRTRDRLYFTWDAGDNIWVYSGDTGTEFWQREGDCWSVQPHAPGDRPDVLGLR